VANLNKCVPVALIILIFLLFSTIVLHRSKKVLAIFPLGPLEKAFMQEVLKNPAAQKAFMQEVLKNPSTAGIIKRPLVRLPFEHPLVQAGPPSLFSILLHYHQCFCKTSFPYGICQNICVNEPYL
jgi:hypothetical protein